MKMLTDHQGKPVRLTNERLSHIKEQSEMTNMEAALEATLQAPQLVIRSRTDETANLNY